jgi:flagellar basal-body rod protein FlgB
MDLFDTSTVALERALAGSSLRHEVLASNIANANTPGFRRQEVDFHSVLAEAVESGDRRLDNVGFSAVTDSSGQIRLDGSSVDMEREMASLVQNSLEYQAIVATLRGQFRMLQTVITPR